MGFDVLSLDAITRAPAEPWPFALGAPVRPDQTDVSPPPVDWRDQAACAGYPSHWWFAQRTKKGIARGVPIEQTFPSSKAISICQRCPVQGECLKEGIANREHGIWGGENMDRRFRRHRFTDY